MLGGRRAADALEAAAGDAGTQGHESGRGGQGAPETALNRALIEPEYSLNRGLSPAKAA